MYFYTNSYKRKKMDGFGEYSGGEKKKEEGSLSKATVEHREKRVARTRWPTSSGGKQIHVDAAQSGVHHFSTYSTPTLKNYPTPTTSHTQSHPRPPIRHSSRRSYRSLGSRKTPGNHRRQLSRAPLSRTSTRGIWKESLFARSTPGGSD